MPSVRGRSNSPKPIVDGDVGGDVEMNGSVSPSSVSKTKQATNGDQNIKSDKESRSKSGSKGSRSSASPNGRSRSRSRSRSMSLSRSGSGSRSRSRSRSRTGSDSRSSSRSSRGRRRRSYSESRSRSRSRSDSSYSSRSNSRGSVGAGGGSRVIEVLKLTKHVTAQHLHEIFGTYGTIKEVDLPIVKRIGSHLGKAIITFDTAKAAQKAISHMDRGQLDGSLITVSIHRAASPPRAPAALRRGGDGYRAGSRYAGSGRGPPYPRRGNSPPRRSFGGRSRSPPRRSFGGDGRAPASRLNRSRSPVYRRRRSPSRSISRSPRRASNRRGSPQYGSRRGQSKNGRRNRSYSRSSGSSYSRSSRSDSADTRK